MGTPERYARVQEDYITGICQKKNLANKQKAIFLDRDGTINEHVGFLRRKEEFVLLPGVTEAIKQINNSEYLYKKYSSNKRPLPKKQIPDITCGHTKKIGNFTQK